MKTLNDYNTKVNELNLRFSNLNERLNISDFGGRFEIEVSTVDKAKALNEIFIGFNFTSGKYK